MTSSAFEARRSALNGSIAAELIRSLLEVPTYVLGPVALYLRPPLSTQPSLFPMTVDDELLLPMPLREYLFFAEQRLTGVGFDAPVRGVSRQHLNVEGYASLLEQRHDGALAIIYAARMTNSRHVNATVLLHSGFSDGTILATTNSQLPSRMPPLPEMHGLAFPDVDDPAELYGLHRIRAGERGRRVVRVPMTRGADPFAYQARENARVFEHWVRRGYYRRIGSDKLRCTLRGAVLSVWRGMFPWRHVTAYTQARERAAVLRRREGGGAPRKSA